jgi:opacity protein-like surface antigen
MIKRLLIAVCILAVIGTAYAAMTATSFTPEAKRGFAWYLTGNQNTAYADFEPQLIAYINKAGEEFNVVRINENAQRQADLQAIRDKLRLADDASITAIKATLGIQ